MVTQDKVFSKLEELEKLISQNKPNWFERVFWGIEKALIPITVAVIAYLGNQAATKISHGQLALARAAADDRKAEFSRTMQSKYLELFYRDITSKEPREQANAMALLQIMDPSLARDLSAFVQASTSVTPALKAEVKAESQKLEAAAQVPTRRDSGPLSGYKVGIYFLASDTGAAKAADKIETHLRSQGFRGFIQRYPSSPEFWDKVVPPTTLEIRFEEGLEDRQANALKSLLTSAPLRRKAELLPVGNTTQNFISIFVPSGG
ncbi:hypothetical protein [Xanthomonas sp. SHU 166]|uniref:hypothetical protein n=1 Tax=Xanthomonas sp. SHU 166 TaxID=1591170 RepID=UPI0012FF596D|nr:hypothetical protein [Xanthomonas sp. SHU 166]